MIKIMFVPNANLGITLWRIENYAQEMVKFKDDCAVYVSYFYDPSSSIAWDYVIGTDTEEGNAIRERLYYGFKHHDVIIIQNVKYEAGLEFLRKCKKDFPEKKIFLEIDDLIGEVPQSNIHYEKIKEREAILAEVANFVDGVITTNDYLKKNVMSFRQDKDENKIHIAPNVINPDTWKYEACPTVTRDTFRFGYVAGGGHDEDLQLWMPAILKFFDDNKKAEFVFRYGGYRPSFLPEHPQIDFKQVNWNLKEYPQKLYDLDLDLFIAPLRDTHFNRAKSNLKIIEATSFGKPILCSDVYTFKNTRKLEENPNILFAKNSVSSIYTGLEKGLTLFDRVPVSFCIKEWNTKNYNINEETKKYIDFLSSQL